MTLAPVASMRAEQLVSEFRHRHVLVVGDVMLDRFIVGRVQRISPEAPVPVVRFEREYLRLGGAANVAQNLSALQAGVSLVGVVGRDEAANMLRQALASAGIGVDDLIEDSARPTVEKTRVVTDRHQHVARIDREIDADISGAIEEAVVSRIGRLAPHADAILVSDYLKGAITKAVIASIAASKRSAVPLVVDPKIPHLDCYSGATLITPNNQETEEATHSRIRTDTDVQSAAEAFRRRTASEAVLVTRGEQGMWLSSDQESGAVRALAREVSDVTGAGDTVAATVSLAIAAGATLAEAAVIANHAASIVVGKFGPATVTPQELLASFTAAEQT